MKASKEKNKISMEKYLEFVDSSQQVDIKVDFLNQIISMHGFKKITRAPKRVLSDAVRALDLMDPSRSTLEEDISSCVSITLNDVIDDLNELAWQECCVTSINILNNNSNITTTTTNRDTYTTSQLSKSLTRDSSASTPSYFGFDVAGTPVKLVPKRKRS